MDELEIHFTRIGFNTFMQFKNRFRITIVGKLPKHNFFVSETSHSWLVLPLLLLTQIAICGQQQLVMVDDFVPKVTKHLKDEYRVDLQNICKTDTDSVDRKIFAEYGAIFISASGTRLPSRCIFDNEAPVYAYQSGAGLVTKQVGGGIITLQAPAMNALENAHSEARKNGLSITPRGGTLASTRSYAETVRLWNSRFLPALNYWAAKGRISKRDAAGARLAPISEQIRRVFEWEENGMWFSKDRSKSILYSVAAPGASQHNFGLALDVMQFSNKSVRDILAKHGWFQTVKSDLPHFTYLGRKETELPGLGLKKVTVGGQTFWIPNM